MASLQHCHNILDHHLSPSSPWNMIAALKPRHKSSFSEIFGVYDETPSSEMVTAPDSFSSSAFSSAVASPFNSDFSSSSFSSSSSSEADVETLIGENGDVNSPENDSKWGMYKDDETEDPTTMGVAERPRHRRTLSCGSRRLRLSPEFPPPLPSIGRSGKPWVVFRSFRGNGRVILQEFRVPTQEFMQSKDGRLKIHIIQSDDEIPDEEEYNDDEDDDDVTEDGETEDYETEERKTEDGETEEEE